MKRLYEKNELWFALFWIFLYVVIMNIALQFCGGLDNLASKTIIQMLVPVISILIIAFFSTLFIIKNNLKDKYGLYLFKGNYKTYLWFIPLIIMSCINLKNGLGLKAPLIISILMIINISIAGYVEEIIFRGFLFKAMLKDGLKSAIIVSAITFGVGHIINLANTSDTLSVILQVCYAIVIGFLYTIIVYKGGSLIPCIISHMFVNGTSVLALENGPFTNLVNTVFNNPISQMPQIISALLIIIISGTYAIYLWREV